MEHKPKIRNSDSPEEMTALVVFRFITVAVIFSILMAWLGTLSVSFYEREDYPTEWLEAQWIQPSTPAAVAYYRHQLLIPGSVSKAYLRIAASDSFDLYVNGTSVASSSFYSSYPSAVFDIAAYLTQGVNVIAIRVTRKTYPGAPELIVNGVWHSSGRKGPIQSNHTWRAINLEEVQLSGKQHWYDTEFQDLAWPSSVYADSSHRIIVPLQPWSNETLMQRFPKGQWIWSQTDNVSATFNRNLSISGKRLKHGWLGVSAGGVYSISVNGTVVVTSISITHEYLDVYNIGPYLRQGDNSIAVDVSGEGMGGRMMITGMAQVDGQWLDFSSGQHWLASVNNLAGESGENETLAPVRVWSEMHPIPARQQWRKGSSIVNGFPTLRPQDLKGPRKFTWDEWVRFLTIGVAMLVSVCVGALLYVRTFDYEISGTPQATMLAAYCKPYYLGIILLVMMVMLSFDIRVTMTKSLASIGFYSILSMVSFWLIIIAMEMLLKPRNSRQV